MNKKKVMTTMSLLGMFFLLVSLVSAFGVAREYWDGKPLRVHPGEEVVVELNLQNTELNGDVTVEASFTNDANGMASFVYEDNTYLLKEGTHDTYLPIRFTVAQDAEIGSTVNVGVRLTQVSTDEETGVLTFSTSTATGFPILITVKEQSSHYQPVEEAAPAASEEETSNTHWYLIIAVVIVLIIFYMKRKNGSSTKRKGKKK